VLLCERTDKPCDFHLPGQTTPAAPRRTSRSGSKLMHGQVLPMERTTGAKSLRRRHPLLTGANAARKITPMRLRAAGENFRTHTCSLPTLRCQHLRQRFSILSLKPVWVRGFREADRALLGKRDTAPQRNALPMNVAVDNFSPADEKRSAAAFKARVGHSSRRAVFVHRGFCRPRMTPIQSHRSERMNHR